MNYKISFNDLNIIIKLVLIAIPVIILMFLLYKDIAPRLKYKHDFKNSNRYISKIKGFNNTNPLNGRRKILRDGIYFFTVDLVDIFTDAKIKMKFKNESNNYFGIILDAPSNNENMEREIEYFYGPQAPFANGTLIRYDNTIYVMENGLKRQFELIDIFNRMGYKKDDIIEISKQEKDSIPDGAFIEEGKYPDGTILHFSDNTFYLIDQGRKRFITPEAFEYKFNRNNIIEANNELIRYYAADYPTDIPVGLYSDGTLIKEKDNNEIYLINNNKKLLISYEVCEKLNYDWDSIKEISSYESSFYPISDELNIDSNHPNGTVLQSELTGQKYLAQDGFLKPFISEDVYNPGYQKVIPVKIPSPDSYSRKEYYLDYPLLNSLKEPNWSILQEKELALYQKVKSDNIAYKNIDEFIRSLPKNKKIAILPNYKLPDDIDYSKNKFTFFNQYLNPEDFDYIIGYYKKPREDGEWLMNEYTISLEPVLRDKKIKFFLTTFGAKNVEDIIIVDSIEITLIRETVSLDSIQRFIKGENK